ncbi:MAG: hypothetical protein JWM44_2813 [Bacilli bacterium]|nr:hypothetical protein [Bacilli bacterium]
MIKRFLFIVTALILIASSFTPSITNASNQGVYLSPTVFFTLDNVSLSSGTDSQTLNFTLNLTNQSDQNIDLNQYGVRVLDKDGNKFSAQLNEKASARVLSHQAQGFKYAAQVPKNISIGQLSVDIFVWDFSTATYTRDLGSIGISPTVDNSVANANKVVLNMGDLNSAIPSGSSVSFELVRSYKQLVNGVWSIYSDMYVDNQSSQALSLPANLLFNLRDENKQYYSSTIISGGGQPIPANQRNIITLQTTVKALNSANKFSLEFSKRTTDIKIPNTLLGKLSLEDSYAASAIGNTLQYVTKGVNSLDMVANKVSYNVKSTGIEVNADFTFTNKGLSVLTIPDVTGTFQVTDSTLTIGATDSESHPGTLSPNQSTTYHYYGLFPKGTDVGKIQLVITENKSAILTPIDVIVFPQAETAAFDMKAFDSTLLNHAMVSFQAIRSYHSMSNGMPAINVDVLVANQSDKAIILPTSLQLNVKDGDNLTYPTTTVNGAGQSIMPHQSLQITLQAVTGKKDTSNVYSLEIAKKGATAADLNVVYDTFALSDSFANTNLVSNTLNTSLGKIGVTLKSTYRLSTITGDDVLMSEIQLQNLDNKAIALPTQASFYGGYMIDDFDALGKVIRIQSSPNLFPNQTTTVYIYTKIPYTTLVGTGYIYLGDGTLNTQTSTWSQTHEWTELPLTINTNVSQTDPSNEWMISDPGRTSTGKIVDSGIYDLNSQKMLAVRILDTNKETRSGIIVPYTGYLTNADGTVLPLKTTDDSANTTVLSKEGTAISTLWITLPTGFSTDNQRFVFGQKIDDQIFTTPQQYLFNPTSGAVVQGSTSADNLKLYPYNVSIDNLKMTSGINGSLGYTINFNYTITKALDAAGAAKDRSLVFTLTDNNNVVVKTWGDIPLDGAGAWTTGANKLTLSNTDIQDLTTFLSFNRQLKVYDKFEGGMKLLGTMNFGF